MDEAGTSIKEETATLKRSAEENNELGAPPSKVQKTPGSFKNVFRQLSLMKPGLLFDLEEEKSPDGVDTLYTMVVDVDGVKFRGTGPSKRNAKVVAAEQVLEHLEALGVKPIPESERPPKPENTNKPPPQHQASTLTEEQKEQQMMGKNPVMMLHEMRPSFDCEIVSDERKGTNRRVEMSITVDGSKFTGAGRSNKIARARAAVSALETLFNLEFTDFGENEIPVYLGEEWKWRMFTKKAEKAAPNQTPEGKHAKNAMMQLNDMYKGLEFKVKERSGPDHCPFFKVGVEIEGQTFEGQGSTKKAAKLDAAEKALVGLSLTGALAQRASQKKQQKWGTQRNWNNGGQGAQGKNVPQLSQSFQPASNAHNGSGGKPWQQQSGSARGRGGGGWNRPSWMNENRDSSQNGQTGSGRGGMQRGRGRGAMNRGRGRGMGRGNAYTHNMDSFGGMSSSTLPAGQMPTGRGRAVKSGFTNRLGGVSNSVPGFTGGLTGGSTGSAAPGTLGRTRGQTHAPLYSRTATTMSSQTGQNWDQQGTWSEDFSSYTDPYDTNSQWKTQGYGYDTGYDGSYEAGYDASYDTTYETNYDTTYDTSFTGGYQAEGTEWNSEYYHY